VYVVESTLSDRKTAGAFRCPATSIVDMATAVDL